jgi:CheY-like chemotaxis protein
VIAALDALPSGRPRVLFVDDEPAVLEALAVGLRRNFDVVTATSGALGLEYLRAEADFAVVVSDMRMPKMDGATFLALALDASPDTTRILLTGQADVAAAIKVINHAQIFRFLTKPCPRDTLRTSLDSAVLQHRLITGERVLLEQTLRGAVKMLIDVLAITSPAAFGRANHIKTRVLQLAARLGVLDSWQLEIAALASQLGHLVLPSAVCDKLEHRIGLNPAEQAMVIRAPAMTEQLLANIPRLETVRAMLALHVRPPRRNPSADGTTQLIELGAHLLRVAVDLEALEPMCRDPARSPFAELGVTTELYDPEILEVVAELYAERAAAPKFTIWCVTTEALEIGMVLADDVYLHNGALLVARGYEVTAGFLERLKNFAPGVYTDEFRIAIPC